ncbi:MAG: DUF2207 domain-containing protein [Ruminococcus sp.]|nr:DUF2207 domain-containing protein [Ruminococcus sp.]
MSNKYEVLTCPRCGANEFDTDLNTGTKMCKYCNTTFVPDPVNEHTSIKKLDNAELYFHKFKDSKTALKYYGEAVELDPSNFRGWWGLAKVRTNNFENCQISTSTYNDVKDYVDKAILTSTAEVKERITVVYDDYTNRYNKDLKQRQDDLSEKIKSQEQEKDNNTKTLNTIKSTIREKEDDKSKLNKEINDLRNSISSSEYQKYKMRLSNSIIVMVIICIVFIVWFSVSAIGVSGDNDGALRNILLIGVGIVFIVCLCISLSSSSKLKKQKQIVDTISQKNQQLTELSQEITYLYQQKNKIEKEINQVSSSKKALERELKDL